MSTDHRLSVFMASRRLAMSSFSSPHPSKSSQRRSLSSCCSSAVCICLRRCHFTSRFICPCRLSPLICPSMSGCVCSLRQGQDPVFGNISVHVGLTDSRTDPGLLQTDCMLFIFAAHLLPELFFSARMTILACNLYAQGSFFMQSFRLLKTINRVQQWHMQWFNYSVQT